MKVQTLVTQSLIYLSLLWALCLPSFAEDSKIPLADVPPVVLETAREEVKQIQLTAAEVEEEDGITVYELEGVTADYEYEMEISKDGKLLELHKKIRKNED